MSRAASVPKDWRDLNLAAAGRSLVQASAGTGKTWTIAVLYLRLLLENGLTPRQIVVTTFSDAAAQELRERLRAKLRWAQTQADSGNASGTDADADVQWLHARWHDAAARALDLQRLHPAQMEMDIAPVGTLHGLCRRILADHPFACGVPFVPAEMIAGDVLLDEVAADIRRTLEQSDARSELSDAVVFLGEPLPLAKLKSYLKILLAPGVRCKSMTLAQVAKQLPRFWAQKLRALASAPGVLGANVKLKRGWNDLADWIDDPTQAPRAGLLADLTGARTATGVNKKAQGDPDVAAALRFTCDICLPLLEQLPKIALHALAEHARTLIDARLHARNQMRFDDLLTHVHSALMTTSRHLADALFATWPVALVDEFQDTDTIQFGILDSIYRDAAGTPRGRLVMIGDPKQAIYRFRGSDIRAYERAAKQAADLDRLSLDKNYRSATALVDALNEFYCAGGVRMSAAEDHAIRYEPVTASGRGDKKPYTVDGVQCTQPLLIHYRPDYPDSVGARRDLALRVCANQIAAMLQSRKHCIGGEPVVPSDIAVLLPTGNNVDTLRDLLRERGVPCVTSTRNSVFATDIARELQVVLYAIAHHNEPDAVRAAAATRLYGASFSQIQQWPEDDDGWQEVVATFRCWHANWRERGIAGAVATLIAHMAQRYLATAGGERAIADLRQLGELLQAQDDVLGGAEELLAWLARRRDDAADAGDDAADAAQQRIESDGARVRLMTLHASKGLEFPIVFLPLLWDHKERKSWRIYLVDDAAGQRMVEVSDTAQARELQDLQDERFRVLYVALTRAIHACHVYALSPQRPTSAKAGATSAQGTARSALDVMLERMQPALHADQFAAMAPHIDVRQAWEPETYRDFIAEAAPANPRRARTFSKRPREPLPARHSFTTLVREDDSAVFDLDAAAEDEAGAPDSETALVVTDDDANAASTPHPALLALDAVRGTDFGNAVHAIFERRVIGTPMQAQHALIEHWLDAAGVRAIGGDRNALIPALATRIQGALAAPLDVERDPGLFLDALPARDLRAEMEFYFPLERVSLARLRQACADHGEADLVPRSRRTLSGLMNGKIDLILRHAGRYHVLDYKSNYLGDTLDDYRGAALLAQMDQHHYRFQALLYTIAVDRYLRQRLGAAYRRTEHLGECFYLFVRAAGLAPDAGIWRHRFADALLDDLDAVLTQPSLVPEAA